MTDRQAEAQAALDAVREYTPSYISPRPGWAQAVLTVLENLDARLKALESERGKQ